MRKLNLDALTSEREAVGKILAGLSDEDIIGRASFEARLADIEAQLAEEIDRGDTIGNVALVFGGRPVRGSQAIDSSFATQALKVFHDLVTKEVAMAEMGSLGGRGPVPKRSQVSLSITDMVRGSLGFVLEEEASQLELVDTPAKKAIETVTRLLQKTASNSDVDFEEAVESLDPRVLVSLKEFFTTLDESGATVRIVEDAREALFDSTAVRRARVRMDSTQIEEESNEMVGELLGLLPQSRHFEMRLLDSGLIIKGGVVPQCAEQYLKGIESSDAPIFGRNWRVKMRIRTVTERNKPDRFLYTLVGLLERIDHLER